MRRTIEKYLRQTKKTKLDESRLNKIFSKFYLNEAMNTADPTDFDDDGDDFDMLEDPENSDNSANSMIKNYSSPKSEINKKIANKYIEQDISNKEFNKKIGNINVNDIKDDDILNLAEISIFPFSNLKYIMDNIRLDGTRITTLEDFSYAKINGNTIEMPFIDGMFDQTTMSELFIDYGKNSLGNADVQKRMDDLLKDAIKGYKDCKITEDEFKEISKNLEVSDSSDTSTYRLPVDYVIKDQSIASLLVSFVSVFLPVAGKNKWCVDNGCRIIPYTAPGGKVGYPIYSSVILDSKSIHAANTIEDARNMILESEKTFNSKILQYLKIALYILVFMTIPNSKKSLNDTFVQECINKRMEYCQKNNIEASDSDGNALQRTNAYVTKYKKQSSGNKWYLDDMSMPSFIIGKGKLFPVLSGLGLVKPNSEANGILSDFETRMSSLSIENKVSKNHPVKNLFSPKDTHRSGGIINLEKQFSEEQSTLKHSILSNTMIARIQQSINDVGKK